MDELQNLEQLLQELLNGIQQVVSSGEILSDQFQGVLAQELEFLTSRIDELKSQQIPTIPPLDKSMPSSVIEAFKYDPKKGNLLVQFKGKYPNAKGSIYSYSGFPKELYELFRKGATPARTKGKNSWGLWFPGKHPSMGSALNILIKQMNFPFTKLT